MFVQAAAAGLIAGAGLIIAIGAQNAFVLRQGLKRQHVGLIVLICAAGDIALIVLGVAGIGALVKQWPGVLQVLRYAGAAFLAAYGILAARRAWHGKGALAPAASDAQSWRRAMLTCLAFTFLNPHVYLDTMVLLGSVSARYPGASCAGRLRRVRALPVLPGSPAWDMARVCCSRPFVIRAHGASWMY